MRGYGCSTTRTETIGAETAPRSYPLSVLPAEAEIVELADRIVRAGFATRDEAVAEIVEVIGHDDPTPELLFCALEAVDRAMVAHDHEERLWGTTDNDRLARAAMSLEANGILFRQNFACCQNCGFQAVDAEVERAVASGQPARGFVFFHWNDTERAVDGHGLALSYTAVGNLPTETMSECALAIATELVDVLGNEGLVPKWSGKLYHRVKVPMRWQRRRFTAPPE